MSIDSQTTVASCPASGILVVAGFQVTKLAIESELRWLRMDGHSWAADLVEKLWAERGSR